MYFLIPVSVLLVGCADRDPKDDDTGDTPPLALTGSTEEGFGTAITPGAFGEGGTAQLAIGDPTADGAVSVYEGEAGDRRVTLTGEVGSKEWAGYALAGVDLDSTAADELIVGAPHYDADGEDNGRVYVLSAASVGGDGALPTAAALVGVAGSEFGYALAAGAHIAGGATGFAVGAPGGSGGVYLYGDADLTSGSPRVSIAGDATSEDTGAGAAGSCPGDTAEASFRRGDSTGFGSVLAVGDLDGDGTDDLAIGWPAGGAAYVYLDPTETSLTAGDADHVLTGLVPDDGFGAALAIGDFDTDGAGELAVGAPYDEGCDGAIAIFGAAELTGGDHTPRATLSLSDGSGGGLGTSLSAGADLDGDGRDELFAGAPFSSNGRAWILSGPFETSADLDGLSASALIGDDTGDYFGFRVLSAGLYGGDVSRTDVAVSALGSSTAYVYLDPAL